jgi:hypothetical protein
VWTNSQLIGGGHQLRVLLAPADCAQLSVAVLEMSLLQPEGFMCHGFEAGRCVQTVVPSNSTGDSTGGTPLWHDVVWSGHSLAELRAQSVALRFQFGGALFAFTFGEHSARPSAKTDDSSTAADPERGWFVDPITAKVMHDRRTPYPSSTQTVHIAAQRADDFSFTVGGQHSAQLLPGWSRVATNGSCFADDKRRLLDITYTQPENEAAGGSRLQALLTLTDFLGMGPEVTRAREQYLTFRNMGHAPSPPLCNVRALDAELSGHPQPTLHRFSGSKASAFDFLPFSQPLPPEPVHGASAGDPSSNFRLYCGGPELGESPFYPSCLVVPTFHPVPPTAKACVAACQSMDNCSAVVYADTTVNNTLTSCSGCCQLMSRAQAGTVEQGFSSWTRAPVGQLGPPQGPGGSAVTFSNHGGRSSDGELPYFAVHSASAAVGRVVSIGWSGGWTAEAGTEAGGGSEISVRVGHGDRLCTVLAPGQSLRSMRVLSVDFTSHDVRDGWNAHRKLLVVHYLPRDSGGALSGQLIASWSYLGFSNPPKTPHMSAVEQGYHLHAIEQTSVEAFWIDYGWFGSGPPGNWSIPVHLAVDEAAFPDHALQGLFAAAKASARPVKSILWHEPETIVPGTWVAHNFPQYTLRYTASPECTPPTPGKGCSEGQGNLLFNLGDYEARIYMTDYLSRSVREFGLDVLRIDFNTDPAPHWRATDTNTTRGLTESRYIDGLYCMWDEILAKHPGLLIDTCASGGRRIDLETLSRAVPLWRSDFEPDGVGFQVNSSGSFDAGDVASIGSAGSQRTSFDIQQTMTIGLAHFAPIASGAVWGISPYAWRSSGITGKTITWGLDGWRQVMNRPGYADTLRSAVAETLSLRPFVETGDFYAIAPVTNDPAAWMGYQFHRAPHTASGGSGFMMLFRRCHARIKNNFTLNMVRGLLSNATYRLSIHHRFAERGTESEPDEPVRELKGVAVQSQVVKQPPCSAMLIFYSSVTGSVPLSSDGQTSQHQHGRLKTDDELPGSDSGPLTATRMYGSRVHTGGRYCCPGGRPSCNASDVEGSSCGGYFEYGSPALVLTGNGTLLSFNQGERLQHQDDNNWIDIVLRRSFNRGRSWQGLQVVHSENTPHTPAQQWQSIGQPTPVLDKTTGTIWLLMARNNTEILVSSSVDHGASWAAPRNVPKPPQMAYVAPAFSAVQLRHGAHAGDLVACFYYSPVHHPGLHGTKSGTLISSDHGSTWFVSGSDRVGSECSIAEMANGTVVVNARNDFNYSPPHVRRAISWSQDGGRSFSPVFFAPTLPDPVCEGAMVFGEHTPSELRVGTPLFFTNAAVAFPVRANITLKMSVDGAVTWSEVLLIQQARDVFIYCSIR